MSFDGAIICLLKYLGMVVGMLRRAANTVLTIAHRSSAEFEAAIQINGGCCLVACHYTIVVARYRLRL